MDKPVCLKYVIDGSLGAKPSRCAIFGNVLEKISYFNAIGSQFARVKAILKNW